MDKFVSRIEKARLFLCSLYLALGPSVWFATFKLGPIKYAILVLLCLLSLPLFFSQKKSAYLVFGLTVSLIVLSFYINPPLGDTTILIFGIVEDFVFFALGYHLFNNINNIDKYINIALLFPVVGCVIALFNYVTGLPNWYAPDQLALSDNLEHYEMYPLWATGFSWTRNGWGCTLSVLMPICFLLPKGRKYALLFYIILITSVFVCGNRNGLLASVVTLFILLTKYRKMRDSIVNIRLLVVIIITGLVLFGSSFIIASLRLNSGDLSSGRIDQYMLIPDMLKEMGIMGMGHNGTREYLYMHGYGFHLLHNTYFKVLIEYGWFVGLIVFVIVVNAIKCIRKALSSNEKSQVISAMILTAGLLICLFEPMTVFGVFGGYSIWWLALGYLNRVQSSAKK